MSLLEWESAYQIIIKKGKGSIVYDNKDRAFLDASAGLWNLTIGHGNNEVIEAIEGQLRKLTYLCSISMRAIHANDLSEILLSHAPPQMGRAMFHCTGTAAIESAILLVRQYFIMTNEPQKTGVVSVDGSYHGCSLMGVTVSGYKEDQQWLGPLPPGFFKIGIPDNEENACLSLESFELLLERVGADNLGVFIFEPIMGVAGIIIPPPWWIERIIDLCTRHNIKVIADEVTVGLGRTGTWYSTMENSVDIITLGKGISGGYVPLAANLIHQELYQPFCESLSSEDFKSGSTMDGCPASCAAGTAVLKIIEREKLVGRASLIGNQLLNLLKPLENLEMVGTIRGQGLMLGIPLVDPITRLPFQNKIMEQLIGRIIAAGILLHPTGSTLAILPPLTISESEVELLINRLSEVLYNFNKKLLTRSQKNLLR